MKHIWRKERWNSVIYYLSIIYNILFVIMYWGGIYDRYSYILSRIFIGGLCINTICQIIAMFRKKENSLPYFIMGIVVWFVTFCATLGFYAT